jgi:predicted DNA-binding transcriptional regulator AlpA
MLGLSASGLLRLRRQPGFPQPLPLAGAPRWHRADVEGWLETLRLRTRAAAAAEAARETVRPGAN